MHYLHINCKYFLSFWTDIIRRYIVIFLASKLFNFAPSLLFLRISDNFSTGPEYVMRTSTSTGSTDTATAAGLPYLFSEDFALHYYKDQHFVILIIY